MFKIAKQISSKNKDVTGGGCMRGRDDKIILEDTEQQEPWREHCKNFLMKNLIGTEIT